MPAVADRPDHPRRVRRTVVPVTAIAVALALAAVLTVVALVVMWHGAHRPDRDERIR